MHQPCHTAHLPPLLLGLSWFQVNHLNASGSSPTLLVQQQSSAICPKLSFQLSFGSISHAFPLPQSLGALVSLPWLLLFLPLYTNLGAKPSSCLQDGCVVSTRTVTCVSILQTVYFSTPMHFPPYRKEQGDLAVIKHLRGHPQAVPVTALQGTYYCSHVTRACALRG